MFCYEYESDSLRIEFSKETRFIRQPLRHVPFPVLIPPHDFFSRCDTGAKEIASQGYNCGERGKLKIMRREKREKMTIDERYCAREKPRTSEGEKNGGG